MVKRFVCDEEGSTAVEYGLIAALVAVAVIGALLQVQQGLQHVFKVLRGSI